MHQDLSADLDFFVQKAVLEEAGYPQIHTVDEYFQIIEDYMAKHPEIDGVKTTGFENFGRWLEKLGTVKSSSESALVQEMMVRIFCRPEYI